jgi:hypothetical protein
LSVFLKICKRFVTFAEISWNCFSKTSVSVVMTSLTFALSGDSKLSRVNFIELTVLAEYQARLAHQFIRILYFIVS